MHLKFFKRLLKVRTDTRPNNEILVKIVNTDYVVIKPVHIDAVEDHARGYRNLLSGVKELLSTLYIWLPWVFDNVLNTDTNLFINEFKTRRRVIDTFKMSGLLHYYPIVY